MGKRRGVATKNQRRVDEKTLKTKVSTIREPDLLEGNAELRCMYAAKFTRFVTVFQEYFRVHESFGASLV